jgi:hypothetical protein
MIMERICRGLSLIFVSLLLPILVYGQTLLEATDQAADFFSQSGKLKADQEVIIGVKNYHSQKRDQTAAEIETELYFSLEDAIPGIKLILQSQAITGVSANSIHIVGSYKQKGKTISIQLQAVKDLMSGEVIAQTAVEYTTGVETGDQALVAVLDLESNFLSASQRKGFSEIFRSSIIRSGRFNLASSSEVDKMDPDQIQKSTGCTRDECGTIIGEQLGVDRVISSTYNKVDEQMYLITAKILDIKKGSIINSETVNHDGDLSTLGSALESLSVQLTGTGSGVQFIGTGSGDNSLQSSVQRITPRVSGNKESRIAALFIDSKPSKAELYFGNIKAGVTPYQNLKLQAGQKIQITLKHQDYYDQTIELTLSGGMNEVATIPLKSKYGRLTITSEPKGADVFLAGIKVGITPYENRRILSGQYLVSVNKALYFPEENKKITVNAGKETKKKFTLKANFGTLQINTKPTGARIFVYDKKGELVKRVLSPMDLQLEPGQYQLNISKSGYEPIEFKATVAQNQTQKIRTNEATLRPLEGYLIVSSQPYQKGASVMIDGVKMGEIPANLTLPDGKYRVEVVSDDKRGSSEITIQDGKSVSLTINIYNKYTRQELVDQHDWWSWKWGSAATGGIIAGLYSYMEYQKALEASSKQKEEEDAIADEDTDTNAKKHRDAALEYNSEVKTHNANSQTGAIVSLGLIGVALWIWIDEPKDPESVHWQPEIDNKGNFRLSYEVRF